GMFVVAGTRYLIDPENNGLIIHDEEAHFLNEPGAAIKYQKAEQSNLPGHFFLEFGIRQAAWVECGVNVMHEYDSNYFHFITETIPRMVLVEEAGVPPEVPYLCTGDLHPNIRALF